MGISTERPKVILGLDLRNNTHREIDCSSDCGPDVDCNCDCACALPELDTDTLALESDFHNGLVSGKRLILSSDVYIAPLEDDYQIVFNPVSNTGQVIVINSITLNILRLFQNGTTLESIVQTVLKMGLDIEDLQATVRILVRLSVLVPEGWRPPNVSSHSEMLVAWLHVTNECNLRCTYCYLRKSPDHMTWETGEQAVDAIMRAAQLHNFRSVKLKFAGGESTLNFDLITRLYDHAKLLANRFDLKLEATILSNGVGITNQMMEMISQRGIRLMISLDGLATINDAQRIFENGAGSFAVVSRTIDRLLGRGLRPQVSVTITDRNIDGLPDLLRYVLHRNISFSLNFYRENDCSSTVEDLQYSDERMISGMQAAYKVIEELLPDRNLLGAIVDRANFLKPHSKTCGVGDNYIVVDERGHIAKCQMDIRRTIGTVDAPDVIALVRNDQIGIQNVSVNEKEGCKDCTWRNWCTGGCPLHTQRATGRYDVKSPNCRIYKAIYPQLLRLEGLRILRQSQRSTISV